MIIPYSGPHFQTNHVNDWPQAIAVAPAGTWVKAIDNVQLLDEAKRTNPGVRTVLRHWDGGWQQFDFPDHAARREHARRFLESFVDGTFFNFAHNVDAIEELNEYWASSHSPAEKAVRTEWVRAACQEWNEMRLQHAELEHIRLVVGNVAVGNDITLEAAAIARQYGAIVGYHPYVPFRNPASQQATLRPQSVAGPKRYTARRASMRPSEGDPLDEYPLAVEQDERPMAWPLRRPLAAEQLGQETPTGVMEDEWPWLSGRWTQMDARFRAAGVHVDWLFTEGGPIGYFDHGGLSPNDGWRHPDVCGGNLELYLAVLDYWTQRAMAWNAIHDGRALGQNLFNSGGADDWKYFETQTPELLAIMELMNSYEPPEEPDPPPPPPPPEISPRRYSKTGHLVPSPQVLQRGQYAAVMDLAWDKANSVFFSADDWALTAVNDLVQIQARYLTAWNVEEVLSLADVDEAQALLRQWVATYYPEPVPELTFRRLEELFEADVWDPPVGSEAERGSTKVWPGEWTDANPFGNRYKLGDAFYYHPGSDLNLNRPSFDLDRNMPVYAPASGQVVYAGVPSNAWQGVVIVRHVDPDGPVAYSRSAHLGQIFVEEGQWLKRGTMLGLTGRNMTDEGPGPFHLHFEICVTELVAQDPGYWPPAEKLQIVQENWVDPRAWIAARR